MALAGASGRIVGVLALALSMLAVPTSGAAPDARAIRTCAGLSTRPTIVGTPGPDTIRGTTGFDVIRGGGGDDRILGRGGPDYICSGPGADSVDGGADGDTLKGGGGDDKLAGGDGDDSIQGQGGTDSADGGEDLDACETEKLGGCESDIRIGPFYGPSITSGDSRVYNWSRNVQVGGSTAWGVFVVIDLPAEAEYVPGTAPACTEGPTDRLVCLTTAIEAYGTGAVGFGFRLPDCLPGGQYLPFSVYASDQYNRDPFPDNNVRTDYVSVSRAPNCPQ